MSHEVGLLGIAKIIGSNFKSVKFKRENRVITLAIVISSIKLNDVVPINPEALFPVSYTHLDVYKRQLFR